jgi:hypothetical protein
MNEFEDGMMEDDDDEEWNKALEKEFEESIEWISISGINEYEDLSTIESHNSMNCEKIDSLIGRSISP